MCQNFGHPVVCLQHVYKFQKYLPPKMCFVSLLSKGLLTEFSTTTVKHNVRGDGVHSYSHSQGSDLMGGLWNTCPWAQRGASALLRPSCQWCGPGHLFSKHFIHYFLFLLLCQQAIWDSKSVTAGAVCPLLLKLVKGPNPVLRV